MQDWRKGTPLQSIIHPKKSKQQQKTKNKKQKNKKTKKQKNKKSKNSKNV